MATRVGFDNYTINHLKLSAAETLDFAVRHGLEGVQFLEPRSIDPELRPDALAAFRKEADARGLYLEVGLPSPSPVRVSRELGHEVSPEAYAAELTRHVEAVAALGCSHARAYIGDRHDRFRHDPPWCDQVDAARSTLRHLAAALRANGVRVAIENHADLALAEHVELLDSLDPDLFGVTLDTGNILMRLDDSVRVVETLAPRVLCTHLKDCVLARTWRGLCWQARPVGSGALPMGQLIDILLKARPDQPLSIELHPRTYDLPTLDATWRDHFPGLSEETLSVANAVAQRCEERFHDGTLERPEAVEAVPWADRVEQWLDQSVAFVRKHLGSRS
ncbi:MAG: sugar phosphate isomerase/epimerase family protein [Isosphaeraceae bacterium]